VVLFAATGCGGPGTPLKVGIKELPTDVILGAQERPVVAPAPPLPPAHLALPAAALPPIEEPFSPPAGPRAAPCPSADPLVGPRVEATLSIAAPPAAATYPFRVVGRYEVSGANAVKGEFPTESARTVENVTRPDADGTFTFDVRTILGQTVTTTSYRVVGASALTPVATPVDGGAAPAPGLYVTSVTTEDGVAEPATFTPSPPILALRTPAESGTSWEVSSVDADTGVSVAWTATIGNRVRVDACGTPLDGVPVRVDGSVTRCADNATCVSSGDAPARQVNPDRGVVTSFVADTVYATQFGGIAIQDVQVIDDAAGQSTLHRDITATIAVEPEAS
jgi:hypothetical protein